MAGYEHPLKNKTPFFKGDKKTKPGKGGGKATNKGSGTAGKKKEKSWGDAAADYLLNMWK